MPRVGRTPLRGDGRRRAAGTRPLGAALLALLATGCSEHLTGPGVPQGATVNLTFTGLPALDAARDGTYELWMLDASGRAHSAGRFQATGPGGAHTATVPAAGIGALELTVEPPGDADDTPSLQRLLTGRFQRGRAVLGVRDAVTRGDLPLRERPGQFTMFSPSDNAENGYPSHEEAGIWLFNMEPRATEQNDMWVRLTPLTPGWVYEGWMVRDHGTPDEVWLSYGKFLPDGAGAVSVRDDTGWGPFSGVTDYRTAGEEEFPGDDWISNPLGYPVPGNLQLPLDLRETTASGAGRWTHVISIEPAWDRGEAVSAERPFLLRPYVDTFGTGGPGVARTITFHPAAVPGGVAEVR